MVLVWPGERELEELSRLGYLQAVGSGNNFLAAALRVSRPGDLEAAVLVCGLVQQFPHTCRILLIERTPLFVIGRLAPRFRL